MIDTTGSNICQRVIQTAHWLSLYIRIVICHCRLHICLLSSSFVTFDAAKVQQKFGIHKQISKKLSFFAHFYKYTICQRSFCRLFSPRQDLLSSLFILFLLCTFCTFDHFADVNKMVLTYVYIKVPDHF